MELRVVRVGVGNMIKVQQVEMECRDGRYELSWHVTMPNERVIPHAGKSINSEFL